MASLMPTTHPAAPRWVGVHSKENKPVPKVGALSAWHTAVAFDVCLLGIHFPFLLGAPPFPLS